MSARGLVSRIFKEKQQQNPKPKTEQKENKNSVKIGVSNKTVFHKPKPRWLRNTYKIKIFQQP